MAFIGKFVRQQNNSIARSIETLTFQSSLTMQPITERRPNGPVYRIFAGSYECGAAFERTSPETGQVYLSLKLDDPSFTAPLSLAAYEDRDDADHLNIVWNRPKPRPQA